MALVDKSDRMEDKSVRPRDIVRPNRFAVQYPPDWVPARIVERKNRHFPGHNVPHYFRLFPGKRGSGERRGQYVGMNLQVKPVKLALRVMLSKRNYVKILT